MLVGGAHVQVRQKLLNTRKRMEDTLAGVAHDDDEEWYDTAEALAQPLLACYWSLWECGELKQPPLPPPASSALHLMLTRQASDYSKECRATQSQPLFGASLADNKCEMGSMECREQCSALEGLPPRTHQ